jgi:hypothetical protein
MATLSRLGSSGSAQHVPLTLRQLGRRAAGLSTNFGTAPNNVLSCPGFVVDVASLGKVVTQRMFESIISFANTQFELRS